MSENTAVRDRKSTVSDGVANPIPIDYPALVETGDLLILLATADGGSVTFTATGWTSLGYLTGGESGEIFYRTATGGEAGSTFDISLSVNTRDSNCIVWSIREDLNPGTPEAASTIQTLTSDPWNPPSLSPSGGSQLYQWLVGGFLQSSVFLLDWDSDLIQRIQRTNITGIGQGAVGAERLFTAATYDPASSTKSSNAVWGAWTVAVPVDQPAASGAPVVETTSQGSWGTAGTSQTLTLPAGVAVGDLLVATIATTAGSTPTITGWDSVAADVSSTVVEGTMLQREADGTEGATVTVNLSASGEGSFVCRRISGADSTKTEGSAADGSGLRPAWPSLTPTGGADNILWLADVANDSTRKIVGWPVNYGDVPVVEQDGDVATDAAAGGVLDRNQATATPEHGQLDFAAGWVAFTAAVYPSGSGPTPPSGGDRMGGTGAIRRSPRTGR